MFTATEIKDQLAELIGALDPEVVPGRSAATMVIELASIEKLAQAGRVLLARRVAESHAWEGSGERTAADWMARQAGTSVSEAAGVLETSKQVTHLEGTASALRQGKLSASQAKAVAHGATADPAAESELLEVAQTDTHKGLRDRSAAKAAAATDDATRQRRIRARRKLGYGIDEEGAFWMSLRGPAADGVAITSLLRPFQEHAFRMAQGSGEHSTFENRNYDAFMTMVTTMRRDLGLDPTPPAAPPAHPPTADPDAEAEPVPEPVPETSPPGRPTSQPPAGCEPRTARATTSPPGSVPVPTRLPGGNNTKVIVLIDHTALVRGHTIAGETCEVAGLGPVPASVVRDLLPDAFVAAVVKKGHDVVNVAHLGRGLNVYQRTAVEAVGLRCSNLACNQTIALQMDHRHPWVEDQVTKLDNQDPLCPDCHRRKTHHGWHLDAGTGRRPFLSPDIERGPPSTDHGGADTCRSDGDGRAQPLVSLFDL